jgi:hypothetical protein
VDDRFSGVETFVMGLMSQENQSWIPVRTSAAIQAAQIIVSDDSDSIDPKVLKLAEDITVIKKIVEAVHKQLDDNEKQSKKRIIQT